MAARKKLKVSAFDFPAVGPFSSAPDNTGKVTFTIQIGADEITISKINLKIRDRTSMAYRNADFTVTASSWKWEDVILASGLLNIEDGPFSGKNVSCAAKANLTYQDGCPCVEPADLQCAPHYDQPAVDLSQELSGSVFQVEAVLSQYGPNDPAVEGWVYLLPKET